MDNIQLLKPADEASLSVFQALEKRETVREIGGKDLTLQVLSNILWAANGVNRLQGPFGIVGRTVASASNSQEIDIYALKKDGAYFYNANEHRLEAVMDEDIRLLASNERQTGLSPDAPLQLIFVADIDKLTHSKGFQEPGLKDPEVQKSYYFVDSGLVAGNVYLYAVSIGLAAWFHNCNKPALKAALKLRPEQLPLFGQTIGYPEKQ